MTDDPIEMMRRLTADLEFALRAEGVAADVRDRIVSRILYGEPDAPHRIHQCRTLHYPDANRFFEAWGEARQAVTSGAPSPNKTPPPCPGCAEPAVMVTAAALAPGWFQVRPCGCMFDIEEIHGPRRRLPPPEVTYGTAVAPTTFLPFDLATGEVETSTLSPAWATRVIDQAPGVRDA